MGFESSSANVHNIDSLTAFMPRTRQEIRAALDVLADALADALTREPSAPCSPVQSPTSIESRSEWLTVSEAAQYTQASKGMLYEEARRGRLRAARIGSSGRLLRFNRLWLDEWLEGTARPASGGGKRR